MSTDNDSLPNSSSSGKPEKNPSGPTPNDVTDFLQYHKVQEEYGADQLEHLSDLEHVRQRPSMYIGDTSARGMHHLVYEVVDNSIDEAMAGHAHEIVGHRSTATARSPSKTTAAASPSRSIRTSASRRSKA